MKACVLSGGASKGSVQIGFLKHLLGNLEVKYDALCGTSVGAINAGFLAMYKHGQEKKSIVELEKMWRNLTTSSIYVSWVNLPKPFSYLGYVKGLWKPSLYNSAPLIKLIKTKYDSDRMKASGKKLRITAVSLNTGKYKVFNETFKDVPIAILASSSFPGAFLPIEIDGEWFTDGGVKEITPLKSAIYLGADSIDVLMTFPKKDLSKLPNIPNMIKLGPRIIDIMSDEIMSNDLARFIEINELIKNGAVIPGKRYIDIRIFRPEYKLTDNSLSFEQSEIGPMIDYGYELAQKVC